MKVLNPAEVEKELSTLPGWSLTNGTLVQNWTFADFKAALSFVNQIGERAEAANHHPDIDIRYNQVRLSLVSHDSKGITSRDISMAKQINAHFPNQKM